MLSIIKLETEFYVDGVVVLRRGWALARMIVREQSVSRRTDYRSVGTGNYSYQRTKRENREGIRSLSYINLRL